MRGAAVKTAMLIIMLFASGDRPTIDHIGMASLAVCEAAAKVVNATETGWANVRAVCVEDE